MWFFGLIVVLLIGAVAVVASGRWGAMSTAYDDRPDVSVPARQVLSSTDIESARFAVALRGYRMDEVDSLLERVAREVAERDRRIADLERAVSPIVDGPGGAGFTSSADYDADDFDDTGIQQPILVGGEFPEPDTPEQTTVEPEQPTQPEVAGASEAAGASETAGGSEAAVGAEAVSQVEADDDESDTQEFPRTEPPAAADEYERLQAEARALLEAQSQPGAPRRTPAGPQPQPAPAPSQQESSQPTSSQAEAAHSPQPTNPAQSQPGDQAQAYAAQTTQPGQQTPPQQMGAQPVAQQPSAPQPAPAPHWTQSEPAPQWQQSPPPAVAQQAPAQPRPSAEATPAPQTQPEPPRYEQPESAPYEQRQPASYEQAQPAPYQQDQSAAAAQPQQREQQEWQFWPPADEQPAAPVWPVQQPPQQNGQPDGQADQAPGQGAYQRPN